MKVAINRCYGGFGLSVKATMRYAELTGLTLYPVAHNGSGIDIDFDHYHLLAEGDSQFLTHYATQPPDAEGNIPDGSYWYERWDDGERTDPALIQVIEELGAEANGDSANLAIVEIPDGVDYEIDEYDGIESIHEKHRSWTGE